METEGKGNKEQMEENRWRILNAATWIINYMQMARGH